MLITNTKQLLKRVGKNPQTKRKKMKQSKAYNYGLMEGARDLELTPTNSSKAGLQTSIIRTIF